MTIAACMRFGPYEILTALGAGGMGEVYRARDTRLDRIAANKILSDHLAANIELRQRFEREARVASSLKLWSRDCRNLYYRNVRARMSVAALTEPDFRADAPEVMLEGPYLNVPGLSYNLAPDGKHFLMIEENQNLPPTTQLNVLNWFKELKR